jgi:hypothetical protein
MDEEEFRVFEHIIYKLDTFYVDWVYKEMKPEGDGDA